MEYEVMIVEVGIKKETQHQTAYGYAWNGRKNMIRWMYDYETDEIIINKGLMSLSVTDYIRTKLSEEEENVRNGEYLFSNARIKESAKIIAELGFHGWRIAGKVE